MTFPNDDLDTSDTSSRPAAGRIQVEPSGIEFLAIEGETVIEAAWRQGIYWPTVCRGQGTCRTCFLAVVSGHEHLEPLGLAEQAALVDIERSVGAKPGTVRLACQLRAHGDLVVSKYGVRPDPATR
jgi:2Fe-2S ferredoxin